MKTIQPLVRYALTLLLCWGVYTETGKWTALSTFLVSVSLEVMYQYLFKIIQEREL